MRIGFAAPTVPGHLNPMTSLALKLRQRGHEVFFLSLPESEPILRRLGMDVVTYHPKSFQPGELAVRLQRLSQLTGPEAVQFAFQILADTCRAALEGGPAALRASRADALVLDTVQRGWNLVAIQMGLPFIHVSNALHFDLTGTTPLCAYDWPHESGPAAFERNRKGVAMFLQLTAGLRQVQRDYSEQMNLLLDWNDPDAGLSKLAHLTQVPRDFDFPSDHWPPEFHYVGPLHDETMRPAVDFPWERLTGEPLIYASMGTLQNGLEGIFRVIQEAASEPGRQLVLSVGSRIDPMQIGTPIGNTIVVQHAPQLELLKRAILCITHAGLNTVLESLTRGVPLVAIPITNDQPGVAARIAYTGTGVFIPLKDLSVERLRESIAKVLANPEFRENANKMQQAISRTNGLEYAADLIEEKLRIRN